MDVLRNELPASTGIVDRFVNIDSRDRDKTRFANTNDYIVSLKNALFGIQTVELVSAEIPKSEYFVDDTNNLLEALIDPVAFASRSPSGSRERLISIFGDGRILLFRIDSAERNSHGVVQLMAVSRDAFGAAAGSSTAVFNASATSHIDVITLSHDKNEFIGVVAYSETENNSSGNSRLVIASYSGESYSFGTEYGFEFGATGAQKAVGEKRMVGLTSRLFAIAYILEQREVRLMVGGVGIDADDVDGRISNANPVAPDVQVYAVCRSDEHTVLVVYSTFEGTFAKVVTMDTTFAVFLGHQIALSDDVAQSVSVDCVDGRALAAVVCNQVLSVYAIRVIDGPSLILLQKSTYGFATAEISMHASTTASFEIDPNAEIRWESDVFSVTNFEVRSEHELTIVSQKGNGIDFPILELQDNQTHRVVVVAHQISPETSTSGLNFYVSETQDIKYPHVKNPGTSSMLLTLDGSVNALYYGFTGQVRRGVIRVVAADNPSWGLNNFCVFVSGSHDVGNLPYTFRSYGNSGRALRHAYQSPGRIDDDSYAIGVGDTGFLFSGEQEVWSFRKESGWKLLPVSMTGPGVRNGAMITTVNDYAYVFGGGRLNTPMITGSRVSNRFFDIEPTTTGVYRIRSLRSDRKRIVSYAITAASSHEQHVTLGKSNYAWEGVTDVSQYFERTTQGFYVSSLRSESAVLRLLNVPNPTSCKYRFELLAFPRFNSIDRSGSLAVTHSTAELRLEAFRADDSIMGVQSFQVPLDMWSNLVLELDPTDGSVASMSDIHFKVTCDPLFMSYGFCAVRDPELFGVDIPVPAGAVTVSLTFNDNSTSSYEQLLTPISVSHDHTAFPTDLWEMRLDPFFGLLDFSLGLHGDRLGNYTTAQHAKSHKFLTTTTASSKPVAGIAFTNSETLNFQGRNSIFLQGSGQRLRELGTGDFTFTAVVAPRLHQLILAVDFTTSTLQVRPDNVSYDTAGNLQFSTLLPSVYASGQSLVVTSGMRTEFEVAAPNQFFAFLHVYIPSVSSGRVPIIEVGGLTLTARDNGQLYLDDIVCGVFPRNQWFHLSWLGIGMANRIIVNGTANSALAIRGPSGVALGGSGWNGTVLLSAIAVGTTPFTSDLDMMTLLSEDHQNGHLASGRSTMIACGSSLRLSIDASVTPPQIIGELFNTVVSTPLPAGGPTQVVFGRENGVLHLVVNGTRVSAQSTVSLGLTSGDVLIGAQDRFNNLVDSYAGRMDDIRFLSGVYDTGHLTQDLTRTMVWRQVSYELSSSDVPLLGRAHGSLTSDSAGNLWLFGGRGINRDANDLWQIQLGGAAGAIAHHLNGSPICSGVSADNVSNPGSRSNHAHCNDGENIYIFGGETMQAVGPYQVTGRLQQIMVDGIEIWSGDSSDGLIYPVYTLASAIAVDSSSVVSLTIRNADQIITVFAFPEDNQVTLGPNAFLRSTPSTMPQLSSLDSDTTTALSDLWRYDINTATWDLLHKGAAVRGTTPGPRSHCHLHNYTSYTTSDTTNPTIYLLPGQKANGTWIGQDLWRFQADSWELIREYSQEATPHPGQEFSASVRPGSSPTTYWKDDKQHPHLLTESGVVYINQLEGEIEETNLHYAIAINGTSSGSTDGVSIRFESRVTLDDSTTFPGAIQVDALSGMDDGCFMVTTNKLSFVELSLPETTILEYDPTKLQDGAARETFSTEPPAGVHTLITGVTYEFRGITAQQVTGDVIVTPAVGGVTIVPTAPFTISTATATSEFTIAPFRDQIPNGTVEPERVRVLLSLRQQALADLLQTTFSHHSVTITKATPLNAELHIAYQDQLTNRHGILRKISFDRNSGNFLPDATTAVLSSQNPTRNITNSNALFGRSVTAFVSSTGVQSILSNGNITSDITVQSSVEATNLNICVLNRNEVNASRALWFLFFVYNGVLRVSAQRSLSSEYNAPVQNLVGEVIRYSNPLSIATSSPGEQPPQAVRICRILTGQLSGEVVVLYLREEGSLYYQDAVVSHCDPLQHRQAPTFATRTFSLLTEVGLISSGITSFEVLSSTISTSNFIVFFVTLSNELRSQLFVREAGVYITIDSVLLATFDRDVKLVQVIPDSNNTFSVQLHDDQTYFFVPVDLVPDDSNPIGSQLRTQNTIIVTFDNNSPITVATGMHDSTNDLTLTADGSTNDSVTVFSVHESENTQVCLITNRILLPGGTLKRRSYRTRITPGDYGTAESFVTELQERLQLIDQHFDCSYHPATTKLTIRNEFSSFRFLLNSDEYEMHDESSSNGLAYILGFRDFKDIVSQPTIDSGHTVSSPNRMDLFGRQYLYLFISTVDGPISSEATSRNKENSFGRIIMSVPKGETMFFTSHMYPIKASVTIPVLTQMRIRLGRFSQISTNTIDDGRDTFLYEPQGMEHSFSLKVTCALDKVRSTNMNLKLTQQPSLENGAESSDESDSDDNGNFFG